MPAAIEQPCLGTERCRAGEGSFGHPKLGLVGQQHRGPGTGGMWKGSPNFAASETDVLVSEAILSHQVVVAGACEDGKKGRKKKGREA